MSNITIDKNDLLEIISIEIDWISNNPNQNPFADKFFASEITSNGGYIITGIKEDIISFMVKEDIISSVDAIDELESFEVHILSDEFHIVTLDIVDFDKIKLETGQMGIGFKILENIEVQLIGNEIQLEKWFNKYYGSENFKYFIKKEVQ